MYLTELLCLSFLTSTSNEIGKLSTISRLFEAPIALPIATAVVNKADVILDQLYCDTCSFPGAVSHRNERIFIESLGLEEQSSHPKT
jgi:hypothetical protein